MTSPVEPQRSKVTFNLRAMAADENDLWLFKDCFDRNGSPKEVAQLRWMYLKEGGPLVSFAFDSTSRQDYVAGIYATMRVQFRVDGEMTTGVQSLDTLTDSQYRNCGLFKRLATDVYARCERADIALVYGFPNANSAPGFFSKLGWACLDPVPFLFKPLRSRYFMRRIPGMGKALSVLPDLPLHRMSTPSLTDSRALRPVLRFTPEVDSVWRAFAGDVRVAVERDSRYLNWRFVEKPGSDYTSLAFYDSGGRLQGVVSFLSVDKHGGRVGYVMDLIYRPDCPEAGRVLLRAAVDAMAADRCDVALAWCFDHSPNRQTYAGLGFRTLPQRLRPIDLHFGARSFGTSSGTIVGDRRNWYLSYADSDTV